MEISPNDLIQSLWDQIGLFMKVAKAMDSPIDHIKFHGALYNDAAAQPDLAQILVDFLKENFSEIPLLVPPHSEIEKASISANHPFRLEVFGDRAYGDNYQLISRSEENSLLTQTNQVISHLESIIKLGQINTYSDRLIPVKAETLCFHGDNPGIMEFLPQVRDRFWK